MCKDSSSTQSAESITNPCCLFNPNRNAIWIFYLRSTLHPRFESTKQGSRTVDLNAI